MRRQLAMTGGGGERSDAIGVPTSPDEQRVIEHVVAQIEAIVARPARNGKTPLKGKAGVVGATTALAMMLVAGAVAVPSLLRSPTPVETARTPAIAVAPATPTQPMQPMQPTVTEPLPSRDLLPPPPTIATPAPAALDRVPPPITRAEPRPAPPPRLRIDLAATLAAPPPDPPSASRSANPSGNGEVARHLTGEALRLALIADAENTRVLNRDQLANPAGH